MRLETGTKVPWPVRGGAHKRSDGEVGGADVFDLGQCWLWENENFGRLRPSAFYNVSRASRSELS